MSRIVPMLSSTVLMVAAMPAPAAAQRGACHAESGARTAALIELYTSEGCSSCPPADRWLSRTIVASDAVALAFHVDYWDRLGWKDRFASAAYTERQYEAMRKNGGRFVYTPHVLLGGHEFQAWRSGVPTRAIDAIGAKPARAHIAIDATVDGDRVIVAATASAPSASDARRAALAVALVDSALVSDVKSGENAGAHLSHDRVVRRFAGFAFDGARGRASVDWMLPAERGVAPAVAAFVQDTANGDVLQALALPLAGCIGSDPASKSSP